MTTDPRVDMISFTRSTAVGRAAMAAASATLRKVSMELGGKNPQITFADANVEAAIDACVFGAYFNAGECCNAGSRILLQRDIADNFVAGLVQKSSAVRVGDPLDPETKVGAIISADHLTKIERHVAAARDAGATLRIGGERLASDGFFMAPTVVDRIDPSMPIASDEVFGPVVTVMTFETLDEAIDLANATTYGLSASVWSRDVDTAVGVGRGVRAGTVWVNTFMDGTPELPFGGYGQSGLGRELGHSAVADYTEEKTLHVHQGLRTSWWLPRT
jgi:betaine-aldehyde dehydrogenase